MAFAPFEVSTPHVIYALLGGFVVLFGMFSLLLREKLYVGEACWAFVFGIAMGPYGANIFNPRGWGGASEETTNIITLEFTRIVLAIGVFAIGAELPKQYMKRHWRSIFFLLVPIMTWGWFVSAGLIYALVPALNFRSALAIAACLTPTDPILAAAVIGGKYADKHVPAHIRHLLAAESGCNDGAAFPFLFIALYLIIDEPSVGRAVKDWFLVLWLYQIVLGTAIGAIVGFGFRHLMKFCETRNLIDRHSYVAQYVSLAIFTIGITVLLGSDDLLATFACGTAFAWDGFFNRQTEESNFSSVIDLLFNIATFIYVGAWIPFDKFDDPELTLEVWRLILVAVLVLLLRRLPVMIALYRWIPDIKTFREAVFCGHFGPMGIGAVFISTLAGEVLHKNAHSNASHQTELLEDSMQPIVAFMVLCSILVHGLSIPSFSLGRRVHSISRTWSRHAPMPDWTDGTKVVRSGEEIVVNRDREDGEGERDIADERVPKEEDEVDSMEKGEIRTPQSGSGSGSGTIAHEHEGASRLRHHTNDGDPEKAHEVEEEKMKDETPPDGLEVLAEWQEGKHTVIERRAGPGEEVEVEVIRNTSPPPHSHSHSPHSPSSSSSSPIPHITDSASKFFRGEREHVRSSLGHHMSLFKGMNFEEFKKHAEEGVEGVVGRVEEAVEGEHPSSSSSSRDLGSGAASQGVQRKDGEKEGTDSAVTDEEEDWADENDHVHDGNGGGVTAPTSSTTSTSKRRQGPTSRPLRLPGLPSSSGSGSTRRRNSTRRQGRPVPPRIVIDDPRDDGHPQSQSHSSGFQSGPRSSSPSAPSHERGRLQTGGSSNSNSTSNANLSSMPLHLRVRQGHQQHARRDSSPSSRSIRFVDEVEGGSGQRSGTTTPRVQIGGFDFGGGAAGNGGNGEERKDV